MVLARGVPMALAWALLGCSGALDDPRRGIELSPSTLRSSDPTLRERLMACARDRRVTLGLLSREVCAGTHIFTPAFQRLP
jgi:hypothetical protein